MKLTTTKKAIQFILFGVSTSLVLTGCLFDSGGGGSVTAVQQPGSNNPFSENPTITISAVYPTSEGPAWSPAPTLTDSSGRLYIKGNSVSISGVCSRGVLKIKVSSNGSFYPEEAPCDDQGGFVFTKVFTAGSQGDFELAVTPIQADQTAVVATAIVKSVRMDDLAPTAPTILSPSASGSYTATGTAALTVSGTCSPDTIAMVGPGNTTIIPSGTTWTTDLTLNSGTTTVYNFYSVDRAGNQSAAGSITIIYTPSVFLKISGSFLGKSNVADSGTGYSMETNVYINPHYVTDSSTGYYIETGFNRIVNQMRSDP